MAKWGEGDPRWIVEERPDATNVNNWHWTEKNACGWSQSKFQELFEDYRIQTNDFRARVTKVEKAEGEANANNRKGKLIFFYEWELTLLWRGKVKGGENYVSGKIVIPNLSEENDLEEIDVNFSVNETTEDAQTMKELLHKQGQDKIREQIGKYIKALKEEFSQGMILPRKGDESDKKPAAIQKSINSISTGVESLMQSNNKKNSNLNDTDGVIKMTNKFQCTSEELYNVLTIPELVNVWTQGSAKINPEVNGSFEFFGGNILGNFTELQKGKKIVQKWRVKTWPSDLYSVVEIELDQQPDHTVLRLKQTGMPSAEVSRTKENWDRYYWDPIKRTFGFGAFL